MTAERGTAVSSTRLVWLSPERASALAQERPSFDRYGPQTPILPRDGGPMPSRNERISAQGELSDLETVAHPRLGDHVLRVGRVLFDFFPDLINERS